MPGRERRHASGCASSGGTARDHAPGLAAVNADAEVMQFINDGVPLTRVESGIGSDRVAEHWRTYGFGLWAVIEKAGERMIGFAGVCHPLWLPGWERTVEVGWRLHRDAWGNGYATEAGRAGLAYGLERLGLRGGRRLHPPAQPPLGRGRGPARPRSCASASRTRSARTSSTCTPRPARLRRSARTPAGGREHRPGAGRPPR